MQNPNATIETNAQKFTDIEKGKLRFDIRPDYPELKPGDVLEYSSSEVQRTLKVQVQYVDTVTYGLRTGYCGVGFTTIKNPTESLADCLTRQSRRASESFAFKLGTKSTKEFNHTP